MVTKDKLSKNEGINDLSLDDIFNFMELYYDRKGILFSHLYNSFNKLLDEDLKVFLENGEHTFYEKIDKNKLIKYKFVYENVSIKPPTMDNDSEPMFPSDARNKSAVYGGRILARVTQIQEITDMITDQKITRTIGTPEDNVPIANIPIMLKSAYCSLNLYPGYDKSECEYDPGGYFIVNGSEKVVIAQDRMCDNKPMVFIRKETGGVEIYTVQVNSKSYKPHGIAQSVMIKMRKDKIMSIKIPIFAEIPVIILFRALGIESDVDIINYISYDLNDYDMNDALRTSLEECKNDKGIKIQTKEEAIQYLMTKMRVIKKYSETDKNIKQQQKRLHLLSLLENGFLPHVEGGMIKKAMYLGYMINRLLRCYLGRIPKDDRDSYENKRIDLPGPLIEELFRQYYRKMLNECQKFFKKRNPSDENPIPIISQIKANIIEQGLKTALLTGSWIRRKGVAQMLQRYSYLQSLSFLRRIDAPGGDASSMKLTGPRHLHPSCIRWMCCISTPEHAKVGLTKHLSITGSITLLQTSQIVLIKSFLKKKLIDTQDVNSTKIRDYTKVFLNGDWLGLTNEPIKLYEELRENKLKNYFDPVVSIVNNILDSEIRIYCDGGRGYCPAICVKDNVIQLKKHHIQSVSLNKTDKGNKITSWEEFMLKNPGVIEYIDMEEQPYLYFSDKIDKVENMRKKMLESIEKVKNINDNRVTNRFDDMHFVKYTHCDFHPSFLFAEIPTNIPFCNSNAGPRNIFNYSQSRQAMGIYVSNYRDRLDISYILYHTQRPLIMTRTSKFLYADVLPCGENGVVGIACYTGYNMEDSLIFNKSSIDRGMFRSMSLKKFSSTIEKNQSTAQDDMFMKPDPSKVAGVRPDAYNKVNEQGFAPEETVLVNNDVLICKVSPINAVYSDSEKKETKQYKDSSQVYKSHAPATVDRVWKDLTNTEGYKMIKTRIRSERIPIVGDKFCCYDEQTEILTTDGWIYFKDLTIDHKVASLQIINNVETLVYVNPTEVQNYDYNGDMYHVGNYNKSEGKSNSSQIDLLVTPNHRMYVASEGGKYKIETAIEIYGKRRHYKKNIENVNIDYTYAPPELKIKNNVVTKFIFKKTNNNDSDLEINIDDWIILYGLWIAEGCTLENNKLIAYSVHKETVKNALTEICSRNNFEIIKYNNHNNDINDNNENKGKNIWCLNNKQILNHIRHFSVSSIDKYLDKWVWFLNQSQCRLLIHVMCLEDDNKIKNCSTRQYNTSSKKLANDFQRLCLHAGYSTNITRKYEAKYESVLKVSGRENKIIKSTVESYRMSIITKQNKPLVNKNIKTNGEGRSDSWVQYQGKVYCCTVPGLGVLYVRRNGYTTWSGNSRHGQKGTIGITLKSSDMPFTKEGIQPDIILNPNAIPSRMTIGQLIECLLGKVSAIEGHEADGTPFNDIDIDDIKDRLEKLGYHREGVEYLYNGMTGQKLKTMIFIGPTYYHRMKHLVYDKIHSRARGPLTILTRQPPEGRSRDGGLRLGEMERDALIAHGISRFIKEKLLDTSDVYTTYVCQICGLLASRVLRKDSEKYVTNKDIFHCFACKNSTDRKSVV